MKLRVSLRSFSVWRNILQRFRKTPKHSREAKAQAATQHQEIALQDLDESQIIDEQKQALQTLDTSPSPPLLQSEDPEAKLRRTMLTPLNDLMKSPEIAEDGSVHLSVGDYKFEDLQAYEQWVSQYEEKRSEKLRLRLSPHQFYVTQTPGAMERPFTGEYWQTRTIGIYCCRVCSQRLFTFSHKFDHPTGHASFWNFISKSIAFKPDHLTLPRVTQSYVPMGSKGVLPSKRCVCSNCGSNLGFAFNDGPPPFFKRMSINSAALKLLEKGWLTPPPDKAKVRALQAKQRESAFLLEEEKKFENMREKLGLI